MFLVLTLGLIGTWQVFDQIYVMSQGNPAKTTLTPAFLSYRTAFRDFEYGIGRGDLVRAVPDHRRVHAAAALGACATRTSADGRRRPTGSPAVTDGAPAHERPARAASPRSSATPS